MGFIIITRAGAYAVAASPFAVIAGVANRLGSVVVGDRTAVWIDITRFIDNFTWSTSTATSLQTCALIPAFVIACYGSAIVAIANASTVGRVLQELWRVVKETPEGLRRRE